MRTFILGVIAAVSLTSVAVINGQEEPPPGKPHYERVCAGCHGPTAKGDVGPSLVPMTMDYDELLSRVRQGGGEMPAIGKDTITDEQVKQVLDYLKSL